MNLKNRLTEFRKNFTGDDIIWIISIFLLWFVVVNMYAQYGLYLLIHSIGGLSPAMSFINYNYAPFAATILLLVLYCAVFKKNRFILKTFMPKSAGGGNNTMQMLLFGSLMGFIANSVCVVCAVIHDDLKLYFDFDAVQIPVMLFAFLMVFVQSSAEELWCRGFLYERLNIRYPLWVPVLVNGILFGLMHLLNKGITLFSVINIIIFGVFFSLMRWYADSIWVVMGFHTMWNFTQNFLFGLPNSGLVSEFSVFHVEAASGSRSLIYDPVFGVEGAFPAFILLIVLCAVILLMAKKKGRLSELVQKKQYFSTDSGEKCTYGNR